MASGAASLRLAATMYCLFVLDSENKVSESQSGIMTCKERHGVWSLILHTLSLPVPACAAADRADRRMYQLIYFLHYKNWHCIDYALIFN